MRLIFALGNGFTSGFDSPCEAAALTDGMNVPFKDGALLAPNAEIAIKAITKRKNFYWL